MKFKYSVIGDNTQENREWLENVGYKLNYIYNDEGIVEARCDLGIYYIGLFENVKNKNIIDCRGNSPLFKAVSAMREDSDFGQLFECKDGLFICQYKTSREHIDKECKGWDIANLKKLRLEELQERFKEKER